MLRFTVLRAAVFAACFLCALLLHAQKTIPFSKEDSVQIKLYKQKCNAWEERGDHVEASRCLDRMAFIYWEHKYLQEAINLYKVSEKHNFNADNAYAVSMVHHNLAMIYADLRQDEQALLYLDQVLAVRRAAGAWQAVISLLVSRSVALNNLGRFSESVASLEEALQLAQKESSTEKTKNLYLMLSETYKKEGKTQDADKYYKLYTEKEAIHRR